VLAPFSRSSSAPYALGDQLRRSYEEHPGFRFALPAWEVDPGLLAAFDDTIAFVRARRGAFTPSQRAAWTARSRSALAAVFETLARQAGDALEARFLTELHAECRRLAEEDLAHYARPVSTRGVALADKAVQGNAVRLHRDAHYVDALPADAVTDILRIGAPEIAIFRERAAGGHCTRDDLSINSGPGVAQIARRLNTAFHALGVLDAVSAYTGRRMIVGGVALELSVPQAKWWANAYDGLARAPATLYAHVDESIGFPKSIVYLTDVARENGPTSCYPHAFGALGLQPLQDMVGRVVGYVGNDPESPLKAHYAKAYHQSMSSEPFRRHFMRLPPELRFNSHFGWDVLPDSEAEHSLIACEDVVLGPAGSFIVFDGARLLHRGGLVEARDRIALQVVFAPSTPSSRLAGRLRRALA
jgi:hypothetical protein